MSSSYYVLCMSHDPATVISEHSTPMVAIEAINEGFESHPHCDFLVSRVSGAPVEFGCAGNDSAPCGGHRDETWIDADWLRVLSLASGVEKLRQRPALRCWTPERLNRLRYELGGVTVKYCDLDGIPPRGVEADLWCGDHSQPIVHCGPDGDTPVCVVFARVRGCNCCPENYNLGSKPLVDILSRELAKNDTSETGRVVLRELTKLARLKLEEAAKLSEVYLTAIKFWEKI